MLQNGWLCKLNSLRRSCLFDKQIGHEWQVNRKEKQKLIVSSGNREQKERILLRFFWSDRNAELIADIDRGNTIFSPLTWSINPVISKTSVLLSNLHKIVLYSFQSLSGVQLPNMFLLKLQIFGFTQIPAVRFLDRIWNQNIKNENIDKVKA